jgi:hypothetical protein
MRLKYLPPYAVGVCLELVGVIADSCYPVIKNGQVQYYEYEETILDPYAGEVMILY